MKKLLALVLVLVMALPVFALAETVEIEQVDWETISSTLESQAPGILEKGEFVTLDALGLKIWVPNGISAIAPEGEITLYAFYDAELLHGFSVFAEELPEGVESGDFDALYAYLTGNFIGENVAPSVVNGIACINYTTGDAENGLQANLAFFSADGKLVTFVFEPLDYADQEAITAILLMSGSIQQAE